MKRKVVTREDADRLTIDRVTVKFTYQCLSGKPAHALKYAGYKEPYLPLDSGRYRLLASQDGPKSLFTYLHPWNGNEIIRAQMENDLGEDWSDYRSTDDGYNFIPATAIKDPRIKFRRYCRQLLPKLLFKEIIKVRDTLKSLLADEYPQSEFKLLHLTLQNIEICLDVVTPTGIDFAGYPPVILALKSSATAYKNIPYHTPLQGGSDEPPRWTSGVNAGTSETYFSGNLPRGGVIKTYLKELSCKQSLNRLEVSLPRIDEVREYAGRVMFANERELTTIITKLYHWVAEFLYSRFSIEFTADAAIENELLAAEVREIFPKYSDLAIQELVHARRATVNGAYIQKHRLSQAIKDGKIERLGGKRGKEIRLTDRFIRKTISKLQGDRHATNP